MAMKTVEEDEVGISCFISDLPGFRGVLKQRSFHFPHNSLLPSSLHLLDSDVCVLKCIIQQSLVNVDFSWILFRYSDFIVNEVDRDGTVVQLTSLDAPEEEPEVYLSVIIDQLIFALFLVSDFFMYISECSGKWNQLIWHCCKLCLSNWIF